MTPATRAYRLLIARLSALEPHHGWASAADIPELADEDVACVLAEAPELLAHAIDDEEVERVIGEQLRARYAAAGRLHIGQTLCMALEALARSYVLRDLQAGEEARGMAPEETGVARQGPI